MQSVAPKDPETLAAWLLDARRRTLALLAGLDDDRLLGPRLEIVNPPLWEAGHVAWFQEKWVLRHVAGRSPLRADADALYDSAAVAHERRWSLPLPGRGETIAYLENVRDRVFELLDGPEASGKLAHFVAYTVFHEDMHAEASLYSWQTLGYPSPRSAASIEEGTRADDVTPTLQASGSPGSPDPDVRLPGGRFLLGATPDEPFVFDNEKWAHEVRLAPFGIARTPVTQSQFAAFIDDGGYRRREFWSDAGWRWREQCGSAHPVYWRRGAGGWERRHFDRWLPLEPQHPVIHVNWYEADAWCRWAARRLPTEAEWELAASLSPSGAAKRRYPWGDDPPSPERANLDAANMGTLDVLALAEGDSVAGCRQLIGNVWEWTASDIQPYPGFVADAYEEYSQPWFGSHKVLRGGAWATRSRLLRTTYRNFYTPDRRDVFAGFRTCSAGDVQSGGNLSAEN